MSIISEREIESQDSVDSTPFIDSTAESQRLKDIYYESCEQYNAPPNDLLIDVLEGHSSTGSHLNLSANLKVFQDNKLQENDIHAMCFVIRSDIFITSISLAYNSLLDEACISIGKCLVTNKTLKSLDLTMCDITVDGCFAICQGMQFNQTLETLILQGNRFGPDACISIASTLQVNDKLKHLNIAETDQTSESLISICTILTTNTSIEYLDISRLLAYNNIEGVSSHISNMLRINKTLKTLKISKFGMMDWGVDQIAYSLRGNESLKHLDLSANMITVDGCKALAFLLEKNETLEELMLGSNRIGDDGIITISEVLSSRNTTLKKLWVPNNSITGAGLSSLASALHTNVSLSHVYIWGNKHQEKVCNAFKILCSGDNPRLKPENCDVHPYCVDGVNYLAETGHYLFSH